MRIGWIKRNGNTIVGFQPCNHERIDGVTVADRKLLHELWQDTGEGEYGFETFCFAGPLGEGARALLSPEAKLIWTVKAGSHFEAMTLYYQFMDWGVYSTIYEEDRSPYPHEWFDTQRT